MSNLLGVLNDAEVVPIATLLAAIATLVIAAYTLLLWRETSRTRRAAQRPLLVPVNLQQRPDLSSWLFVANYDFPPVEPVSGIRYAFLGIRNIGAGPALFATASRLVSAGQQRQTYSPAFAHIEPQQTRPLVIRFGYDDPELQFEHHSHQVLVTYTDSLGTKYELNVQLWLANRALHPFSRNTSMTTRSLSRSLAIPIPSTHSRRLLKGSVDQLPPVRESGCLLCHLVARFPT